MRKTSAQVAHNDVQLLSLVNCADTIVGDGMMRGVSGGEKKRVTTGEIVVGPSKVLFMDEISTGTSLFLRGTGCAMSSEARWSQPVRRLCMLLAAAAILRTGCPCGTNREK